MLRPGAAGRHPLGTALLGGQTLFWGACWAFQFVYFSPDLWRGDRFRTA
ncbi:hypothetical protein AB0O42_27845 [Streptomyces sp. NPDC089922]